MVFHHTLKEENARPCIRFERNRIQGFLFYDVLLNQGDDSSILHEIAQKSRIILISFFNLRYPHNESQIRLRFINMINKIIVLIVSDAFNAKLNIGKHGINQSHFLILFAFFLILSIHHIIITVITILFPV